MMKINSTLTPFFSGPTDHTSGGPTDYTSHFNDDNFDEFEDHALTLFNKFTILICIGILLVGIVGNSLVLFVFMMRWSRLKICEIFMVNLAVADLIGTILLPTKHLVELLQYSFHPIGHVGCKVISFVTLASVSVSAFTLVLISIDRYTIVKWPLRAYPPMWKVLTSISATWILSLFLGFIYFFRVKLHSYSGVMEDAVCANFAGDMEYLVHTLITAIAQVVVPIIVITTLYVLIILELRKTARNRLLHASERERKIRLRRNTRATKLFIVIIIIFYVCILPSTIFFLCYLLNVVMMTEKMNLVLACLEMLKMANSCVNPIIYARLHTSFRRMILRLLCSCFFKRFKGYDWGSFRSMRSTGPSMRSDGKRPSNITIIEFHGRLSQSSDVNSNRRLHTPSVASQQTIVEQYNMMEINQKEKLLNNQNEKILNNQNEKLASNQHDKLLTDLSE